MSKVTNSGVQQQLSHTQRIAIHTGINILAQQVHQTSINHGWWDEGAPGQTVGEKIALIHSEVSEALEADRNNEPPLWYKTNPNGNSVGPYEDDGVTLAKPEGVAAELADAIIRILDLCERHNWPIAEALVRKHNYNITRSHRHGGKAY